MSVRTSSRQDPTQARQHFTLADIEDDRRGRDPVVPKWKARAEVPGLSYRHMSRTLWTKPPCQTSGLRGSMASPLASIVISYPARRPTRDHAITEAGWSMLRSCPMVKIIWSTQPVVVELAGRSGRDHQGLVFCADRVRRVPAAVDDAKDSSSKIIVWR